MFFLETKRLIVRRLEKADIPALVALWSDADVTRYMGGPRDPERVKRILEAELTEGDADDLGLWPVIEKSTGEVIGDCGLLRKDVDGKAEIELNYVIAKRVWGHGYATEVAAAIAAHAFTTLGCERLIALIDPANAASERVAVKLGLTYEKDTLRPDGMQRRVYVLTLPLKTRALIEMHKAPVYLHPYLEATDDEIRQRRGYFGEYMLFAAVIVVRDGRVVMIQQRPVPHAEPGVWFFPGGGVGREEAITDAAVREVKEETGLDVELLEPLGIMKSGRQAPHEGTIDTFLVIFAARAVGGRLEPQDTDEVAELRLATIEDIEGFITAGAFFGKNPYMRALAIDCFRRWAARKRQPPTDDPPV